MGRSRRLAELEAYVPAVAALGPDLSRSDDEGLRWTAAGLQSRVTAAEPAASLGPAAFALVREAARRSLGRDVHDTQLVAGAAMQAGMLAVTVVGPGRSLTVTLPAYLHALSGEGVHVVTAGDDHARSNAAEVGAVLRFLGLRVGVVAPGLERSARADAYAADVTYGSYTELGYDVLRDNLVVTGADVVRRSSSVALVDQADVVLVDEGRAPLVIAGRSKDGRETLARLTVRGYLRTCAGLGTLAHAPKPSVVDEIEQRWGCEPVGVPVTIGGRDPLDGRRPGRVSLRQSMALDHDEIDDGATLRLHALRREILNADGDALDRRMRDLMRWTGTDVSARWSVPDNGASGPRVDGLVEALAELFPAPPAHDEIERWATDPARLAEGVAAHGMRAYEARCDSLTPSVATRVAQQVMVRCLDQVMRRYYALRAEWRWPFASTDRSVWPAALDAHRRDDDEWSVMTLAGFRRDTVRYFLRVEVTVKG